jgi:hypothetical protein
MPTYLLLWLLSLFINAAAQTVPTLVSFSLDMTASMLALTWSEAIDLAATDLSSLGLAAEPSRRSKTYRLLSSNGSLGIGKLSTAASGKKVIIVLYPAVLDTLKAAGPIGQSTPTTWLFLTEGAFKVC